MNRRTACTLMGSAAVGLALTDRRAAAAPLTSYTVKGSGPIIMAFDRGTGFYDALTTDYRVIVLQDPALDASRDRDAFTADSVAAEALAVADAVGARRFAWFGFSWGAVAGLQLAARTDRLTALVCGGWPPLGGQYAETLAVTEIDAANGGASGALFRTYYRSLRSYDEKTAVGGIKCPRFVFAGRNDRFDTNGGEIHIARSIADHQAELERMGWTVKFVDGIGHELGGRPSLVNPIIRGFLDPLLLRRA